MKFLCVPCDRPMTLSETRGPDEGSMTLVYACEDCGYECAMLTNPHETQVVGSLGVKIGSAGKAGAAATGESRCPFTGIVQEARDPATDPAPATEATGEAPRALASGDGSTPDCPWTSEAEARLQTIPSFIRPMARSGIEKFARERGYPEIDAAVLDEARNHFGV